MSTSGTGTSADPYVTTWQSGGKTVRIGTGYGTTANDPDVRELHDENVANALSKKPED